MTNDKRKKLKRNTNITYTTGDPDLNIAFFNKRMGTDFDTDSLEFMQGDLEPSSELIAEVSPEVGGMGPLEEAKKKKKKKKRKTPRVVHVAGMP
jgi:hypothetical protein